MRTLAQIAAGYLRFAVARGDGNRRAQSEQFAYDVLDNQATPRVVVNKGGTANDQMVSFPEVIAGPAQEVLYLEYFDPTQRTVNSTVSTLELNIRKAYVDEKKAVQTTDQPLRGTDRVTVNTASTLNDPLGISEATSGAGAVTQTTVANKWTPIFAFKPRPNEKWRVSGFQRVVVDGT